MLWYKILWWPIVAPWSLHRPFVNKLIARSKRIPFGCFILHHFPHMMYLLWCWAYDDYALVFAVFQNIITCQLFVKPSMQVIRHVGAKQHKVDNCLAQIHPMYPAGKSWRSFHQCSLNKSQVTITLSCKIQHLAHQILQSHAEKGVDHPGLRDKRQFDKIVLDWFTPSWMACKEGIA